jgi:plasmid maintenance system antidote protein VapI
MKRTYTPGNFIDTLLVIMGLKNDAALARHLAVAPPVISKIRNNRLPIGASMLINAQEESGISIKDLKEAAGLSSLKNKSKMIAEVKL